MNTKLTYLHLYFLCFAVCLTSSCTSDDPYAAKGDELTLSVGELSRSTTTTDININGARFAIYGDMKFLNYVPTIIFNKTTVTYNGNSWSYGDTQYWFPKQEYSFIATHPADANEISDTEYADSHLSFTYTFPDNFASAHDLMVATHRRMYKDYTSSSASAVMLNFFHIMSRVNFQVKNDRAADMVRVTEIKLEGVDKTGSFTITPAPLSSGNSQTDDYTLSWTGISNPGTLTANIRVDIPETETGSLFPDDNALFMIPQPDNKDIIMEITYEQWDDGEMFEKHTMTALTPIGGWEWGKMYTYTINIEEITREIYVTVSVKDWQSKGTSGITVPES